MAPSSFNVQPYRFYWVETPEMKPRAARLCMGQAPAETASALAVAVADIGSWRATTESQLEWMRKEGFSETQISKAAKKAKLAKWFFHPGMVRDFRGAKMGDSESGELLEDHWHGAGGAAGIIQMGDEEHVIGLRKPDDCSGSAGMEHGSHGRI